MPAFAEMQNMGHEQVLFCRDQTAGLSAIIAIHNTTLGPALGGCRLYNYPTEEAALLDVLRLSRGMSYKAAISGLNLGGGKSVIIGDPSIKSEALFRAFGRHIQALGGRYITAEDMNTTEQDMNYIRQETPHACGAGSDVGGSGDPSPVTAWGVFQGIQACLEDVFGSKSVKGRTIAIQGVGSVGWNLAQYLHERGAKLVFSDISDTAATKARDAFGGHIVEGDAYFATECDVLAPCAIGGIINERTIPTIVAPIVAGGANNVLQDERTHGQALMEKGITFAPDYVINAGGLISVYAELKGWTRQKAMDDTAGIFETTKRLLNLAKSEGCSPFLAANRIAEERIESLGRIQRLRHFGN